MGELRGEQRHVPLMGAAEQEADMVLDAEAGQRVIAGGGSCFGDCQPRLRFRPRPGPDCSFAYE